MVQTRMVKIALVVTIICSSLFSNAQSSFVPAYSTILKSDKGKAIMAQCSRSIPEGVTEYFDLADADIAKLDSNFKKVLYIKSEGCCIVRATVKNLDRYAYQFIGVIVGKQKFIYINAFAIDTSKNPVQLKTGWQENPIIVCDGGPGYWGALFKITDATFSELAINGEG